jgi:hypothetical protein
VSTQEREVEQRLLALARELLEHLSGRNQDGFEIRDFVLLYYVLDVPDPDSERMSWERGPYSGWNQGIAFSTTSANWWVDEMILAEAFARATSQVDETEPAPAAPSGRNPTLAHGRFEERVRALLHDYLRELPEFAPHGYEIADLGIVCQLAVAPAEGTELRPWEIGPYAGWTQDVAYITTSRSRWFDGEMLNDVLARVRERRWPIYVAEPDDDAESDAEEE